MKNIPHADTPRDVVLEAVYTVNKAAKRQRDLHRDCLEFLRYEEVDGFPQKSVQAELDCMGLSWDIELNGVSLSPFAYTSAFRKEKLVDPDKWPDAFGLALDEINIAGMTFVDDAEREKLLTEQEKMAQEAIDAAKATVNGLHKILHAAKRRKEYLYQLKAGAIAKLQVPFEGFHRGVGERELYAFFNEDGYGFHMPVHFNYDEGYWVDTGVEEVDEILWDLGVEMPELLSDNAISMISAAVDGEKSLGLNEEEAVAVVEEFLAS